MRMRLVFAFIILFFVVLLSRIYYLSIKSNLYYEEMAQQNAVKKQFIAPVRGIITDRNGKYLAVNDLGFSVSIKPYLHIKKQNRGLLDEEIAAISNAFSDLNATLLRKNYEKGDSYYNQDFIEVIDFMPYDEMMSKYAQLNLRENIKIEPTVKRRYPYGYLASHIIGYVGKANLQDMNENEIARLTHYAGKSGLERYYNHILQGQKGVREVRVNAYNKEIEELSFTKATTTDIQISIDIELQAFLSELFKDNSGVGIVMDVESGEILAGGSFPEYDLNPFVTGISVTEWKNLSNNPEHPFTNKMVNGLYPPGSVVKMGVGLAFLNTRFINTQSKFFCTGLVELGGRFFRCWNRGGHGEVNLRHAIKQSCDVYFYEGSLKVGIDTIAEVLGRIGFGAKTGVDLPNEFVGIVPSREWKLGRFNKPWFQGETLNTSIGQGDFLITPMQLAKYTAQIAKGTSVTPHFLISKDFDTDKEVFTLLEKSHLPAIKEAMWAVANEEGGTAYRYLSALDVKVAAKTGTAQVIGFSQVDKNKVRESDLKYYSRSHTWLTSYAPYKKPKYAVVVLLEHGGRTITSGQATARIYEKLIKMGYLKKDN